MASRTEFFSLTGRNSISVVIGFQYMLADFLTGVKTPVIVDEVIADKLLPYAEALAKGQQDAESATQAAEKDLRLYLAERG